MMPGRTPHNTHEFDLWRFNALHIAQSETMHVFFHHLYEFKKGLRNLILHTTASENERCIRERLEREQIAYLIYPLGREKMNVFFGEQVCIDVITAINKPHLYDYSDEEDFLLGIMLGYDRKKQCMRYLKRKQQYVTEQLIG